MIRNFLGKLSKLRFLLVALVGLASLVSLEQQSLAATSADLIPQSLSFKVGLDDDVSGNKSLHFWLMVKNFGNGNSVGVRAPMKIKLNGTVMSAYLYGPNGVGGYNLFAPIPAGQQGMVFFRLPLNSVRHCQAMSVQIDLDRQFQYGAGVFNNDAKTLKAVEAGAIVACRPDVVKP